ncbi:hypothetical protein JOE59_003207 [Agromyces cerinus]|uniref:hypothetical protein n=1 Tax=Agromyces cerinus TaxID=33878 RepID=UPI00195CD9F2|nr:hypothetical protein [Agromyces cerinus]MBM7832502.1 hypothetical protein [Agromyces cerinus]
MLDSDPYALPLKGTAVSQERIDDAGAHLLMLRSLLAEVNESVHRLVPPSSGAWRSSAADGYVRGLDDLRARVLAARDGLVDAESALVDRIRRMEHQLDLQRAALGDQHVQITRSDASWTTR